MGPFEPRNELEKQLLAAQEGSLPAEEFISALMDAQVFMPVADDSEIKGFQRSTHAKPLTLTSEEGALTLILFTSPERAKSFVLNHPGYGGGLLTEFKWVLEKMGKGVGIALNPEWDVGFDIAPEMVEQMLLGLAANQPKM